MKTLTRFALALICALEMARTAFAQTAITQQASVTSGAEQSVALPAIPTLRVSSALETAFGYNDNLLLSSADEVRSAFARGRAELFAMNVPQGRFEYVLYAAASGTRYFSRVTVDDEKIDHEARASLNVEPGYRLNEQLKLSLPMMGYYRDEVMDVSNTEVVRRVAAWKLWGGNVAPTLRWAFHPAWWLEASATGDRSVYDDHSEDSRLGAGQVRLSWQPASWLQVQVAGIRSWRNFDTRAQYLANGFEDPGTRLKIAKREGELRFVVTWDRAERWKTTTRASALDYRDNGSGFFNYREKGIRQELKWETDQWLVELEGSAGRLDFDVQTVGFGLPQPLLKERYAAEIRLERTLSRAWTVFGGYTWERRRSNDPVASYAVNEGLLGLRWSWVK